MNKFYPKNSFILLFTFCLIACNEKSPELEKIQQRHKINIMGTFLTESPDEIIFPVKVLFAIDCSLSMGDSINGVTGGSDPHYKRFDEVRSFIDKYNNNDNTSFEIMLWNNDVFETTQNIDGNPGFTKDPVEINRVLENKRVDTMTDYLGTLAQIQNDIKRDILKVKDQNQANLTRSKYIVIFFSDGMSNVQGGIQPDSDIFNLVKDIKNLADENEVANFNFHTFLLSGLFGDSQIEQEAKKIAVTTLQGMADYGNGQFNEFETAQLIDFISIIDMRLTVEYKVKFLFAYNASVKPGIELIYPDSDRDGLSDNEEFIYQTDPTNKDSDDDGLGDYFEFSLSSPGHKLDPLSPDSPCDTPISNIWPDSDLDGFTDCEEFVKGTHRYIPDTDKDGIPDAIEFIAGTNPLDDQLVLDSDFDGIFDYFELRMHTNVRSNDPVLRERYSYIYDIADEGLEAINQGSEVPSYVRKYSFNISNIDLVETIGFIDAEGTKWNYGDNLIYLYIAQVPEDSQSSAPIFRMAEIRHNIYDLNNTVILTPGEFRLIQ